ncbi:IclR family transcriptional regulator [Caballeronia sp. LZ043]|uniref:IclR family transcriptional regulator n=1 Tax=Caballeronia sp. LZ043 TaxID=3038569 RepID=UPI002867847A|nr:IclR family transcriptional regulator [Caballeronia sp. LZ043]MDR5821721.1 IclR family transcriptional regulator [Caballeronia sp. LZ043]
MTKPSDTASASGASATPVERAFSLLRHIADGGSTTNLSEVARQINVNRVTVMRLLESLTSAGLIEPIPSGGGHRLGMPFLTLAASALGSADLTSRARQILPELVAKTGLSAYLAVLEGTELIYLLCETPDTPLVSRIRVGSRIPAHRATPGLAMLATLDGPALADLYAHSPDASVADQPDWEALNAALGKVRETGCAWSFSGLEAGIDSCAAAVADRRGGVLAALSVAGPDIAFSNDVSLRATVEASVRAAASALSRSSL